MSAIRVACPACLTANRVPAARLGEDPKGGRRHEPLLAGEPVELDEANFDRMVAGAQLPVVVDFWALGVRAIPTLVLFHGGREGKRAAGVMDARSLARWIRETAEA
jgi:thioredoxin 2